MKFFQNIQTKKCATNKALPQIKMLLVYNWVFILKVHLCYLHNFVLLLLSFQTGGLIDCILTNGLTETKVCTVRTEPLGQSCDENLAFKPHYL